MATPETYEQSQRRRLQVKQLENQAADDIAIQKDIIDTISQATPPVVSKGQQKLNELIITKVVSFSSKVLPGLYNLGNQLGIQNITSANPTLPDVCPDQNTLQQVYTVRNNIVAELNVISNYLTVTQKSISILSDLLNGQISIVKALALIRTTTSLGAKAIPVLPGAVGSILSDVESLRLTLTFDLEGNPKLEKVKQVVSQGEQYLTQASVILGKIQTIIQVIDLILSKCQPNPVAEISQEAKNIVALGEEPKSQAAELYRGFLLDVESKPYTNTVTQVRGVGKNRQGIILLTTPYSFTTRPDLLISELKFKIDLENLKAD
jgi:hypothetical protein